MIRLENVSRVFRTADMETTALQSVSLEIKKGEFVSVMGPSGCGKSTLLNIVGMIDDPDSGEYHFGDLKVSGRSEEELVEIRKDNIGFIFQSFNLINNLSVYENVEVPLLYKNIPWRQRKLLVREALELVDLQSRANHKPQQLSGGQQQRVAVARSVVTDPQLILADEPTGNLDSRNGEEVMDMLEILKEEGATILMVTHSPGFSQRADRTIHMMDGRIVETPHL